MGIKERYIEGKKLLLENPRICKENLKLFGEFFEYEERKLKRLNGLSKLDESCYKTLYGYIQKFRNVNSWFNNKPWIKLTKKDIKKVYDDLEDGIILNSKNKPFQDKNGYYNRVFKSKPFQMAGKKELAKEVIEFTQKKEGEVRFIEEQTFRELVAVASKPKHKLLLWLLFDIGENISSILELRKEDCVKQKNPDENTEEYRINLRKEILKRSRTPRSEITNFDETVKFLDMILRDLNPEDKVFDFGAGQAKKIMNSVVTKTKALTLPQGKKPTLKDLRSSMACHLLKKGWTRDEINARLGHKPSSTEIDKYINFLAIDRHKPKHKLNQNKINELTNEVEEFKDRLKLTTQREKRSQEKIEELERKLELLMKSIKIKETINN